jgi:hypothetical protein
VPWPIAKISWCGKARDWPVVGVWTADIIGDALASSESGIAVTGVLGNWYGVVLIGEIIVSWYNDNPGDLWVLVVVLVLAEDIWRPLARIDAEESDRAREVFGVALEVVGRDVEVVGMSSIRIGEDCRVEVADNAIFSWYGVAAFEVNPEVVG